MIQDNDESVLSRWSRRKLESRQPAADTDISLPQAVPEETDGEPAAALQDQAETQPQLTDADMPALESLTEDSDYSGFMSAGVSDKLRNLALRKLFMAPVFNIRDGLDEYDEDYTYFEKLGDIVTCDMKHQVEMEEQRLRESLAEEAEAIDEVEQMDEATDDDVEIIEDAETETGSVAQVEPCPEAEIVATTHKEDSHER